MIIEVLLNAIKSLLFICFGWINLPSFPEGLQTSLNSFMDLIFSGINLFGLFIRPTTIRLVIPLLLIIINFDKIYKLTMYVLKKIPFLGIK